MSTALQSQNGDAFIKTQSAVPEIAPVLRDKPPQESSDDVCECPQNDLAIRKHVKKLTEEEIIVELEKLCTNVELSTKYEISKKIGSGYVMDNNITYNTFNKNMALLKDH